MSPMGGGHECETLTCKTSEEKKHKRLKIRKRKGTPFIYVSTVGG